MRRQFPSTPLKPDFIPTPVRISAVMVLLNLLLFFAFRLLFLAVFASGSEPLDTPTLLKALYIGAKFDLRFAILIALPVTVASWIPGINPARSMLGRWIWLVYLTAAALATVFAFVVDMGHYAYLQSRVNATLLQFLETPAISAQMAWESYPVIWMTLAMVAFAASYGWLVSWLMRRVLPGRPVKSMWWRKSAVSLGFAVLLLLGLYGKASYYPLRWSDAFFTAHPLANALALNPVLYFADTLKNAEAAFDEDEVRKYYNEVAAYLGVDKPDSASLNFTRRATPRAKAAGTPNVVVVFLESFSAYKVGALGNPLDSTPNFDALAREGWLFKNFFVPSTGTARSIFTALFGIPDVEPNKTSTRNPLVVDQHTIINSLQGYEKLYFIGGSANWGNLRGVLSYNISGLRIYEEGDYKAPRIDVWGISDLKLFEEANEKLRSKKDKPFFAIIQSAGNHRPYTIPEDSGGYQWLEPETDDLKPLGFMSVKELNSFRFLDHSLGKFMELARREDYFKNTVFFIFGDHGVPGYAKHLPSGMGKHQLTQHQVPFLIYGPGVLPGSREITAIASELDVMPTIASVLGRPYLNTTLGRDLLDPALSARRYAFILIPYVNPPPIGILDDEFFFLIDSARRPKLYRYLSDDPTSNVIEEFPERRREMENLTRGIYQTARYMLYNNRRARSGG